MVEVDFNIKIRKKSGNSRLKKYGLGIQKRNWKIFMRCLEYHIRLFMMFKQ